MSDDTGTTSGGNTLLAAAHLAAERGWRVLPLHRVNEVPYRTAGTDEVCTCPDGANCTTPGAHTAFACSCRDARRCKSKGKHPLYEGWREGPPISYADIEATWDVAAPPNLAVATGIESGFWVFDIDPDKGGTASAQQLLAEHPEPWEPTRIVQTGSGGWHYYFALPGDFVPRNKQGGWADYPGLDVRGEGGLVVVEPSVTDKGFYSLLVDEPLAAAPDWLLDMVRPTEPTGVEVTTADVAKDTALLDDAERARLTRYAETVVQREIVRLDAMRASATPDGSGYVGEPWDGTTFAVACTLLQLANSAWSTIQPSDAYQILFDHAPRDRDFDDEAVNAKWRSAVAKIGDRARLAPERPDAGPVYAGDPLTDPSTGSGASAAMPAAVSMVAPLAGNEAPLRSWDDLGLAQRFIDRHADHVRRIEQADGWAVYDGTRWRMDDRRYVRHLAQKLILHLIDTEGPRYASDPDLQEKFVKWAKSCRTSARITACLTEAGADPALAATIEDFDRDPMLLNCLNGYVDLRTGELRPHSHVVRGAMDVDGRIINDLLMQQAPVKYDIDAAAPRWQKFLDRVMPERAMQEYLQTLVGYSITGMVTERALFLHHGTGANGKSVFLQIMSEILGDYGQVMPRSTLLVSMGSGEEHPTSVARQRGKRFMQASETARNRRLDEEMVKGLTGGEMQTARFMNRDFFDFKPTGKIHLVTNHLPRLTDAASIWSRMHLIGWRETIPESEQDKFLAGKIIAEEAAGVLAWAVRGAQMWHRHGLQRPHSSVLELATYREEQDEFGEFIKERLIIGEDAARTGNGPLFEAYKNWCIASGISKPMRKQDFIRTLGERNLERFHSGDVRGFKAVTIRAMSNDPLMGSR